MGTFAVAVPVSASFTLGNLTGTYPFHANDFDPHVPGVIGYVWPGGGLNTYSGSPAFASVNTPPGYQAPYPNGNPPGAPSSSWYQLQGDSYSPFGAVLAGSTGDLVFGINATACTVQGAEPTSTTTCTSGHRFTGRWDTLVILIPPNFNVPDSSQVVSTITNDYSGYVIARIGPYDRYAPNWTAVIIMADAGMTGTTATAAASPAAGTTYYNHQFIDFTSAGEWYYVRINGVRAPFVAGRYFFKILLYSSNTPSISGEEGTGGEIQAGTNCALTYKGPGAAEICSQFIPTENWPVMLVKGEIDPAILTGTVRYAGYNQTLYSHPIQEAGRVYAQMKMRLDPYTGQPRPDLPTVDAVGYFNATAQGHYEVEGLAPGVYDLYASAAGYPETLVQSGFTVLKGQSLHFDAYLQPGPVIHGNVYSKHQFGDEPWPLAGDTGDGALAGNTYVKIEIYDGATLNHIPDTSANMVSWSPLPCVAGGQQHYYGRRHAGLCDDPRLAAKVAFPWHEYTGGPGATLLGLPQNGYGDPKLPFYQVSAGDTLGTYSADSFQDPMGVGPPQHWYVQGGTTNPFHFEFGVKGEYGAPRDLDGMVPQLYATWVNGLTPGRYYVRAWVFRYVQSALDGSTFQEYYFDVTPNEWAGDVTLPIDLRLSSWVNKTVHFHDDINGITEDPIDTGAGLVSGVLVDANGIVWSYNQSLLGYEGKYSKGARTGWGAAAFTQPATSPTSTVQQRNDLDKAKLNEFAIETGRANIQFWGWNDTWGGENYGIPSGTYTPHVYALGYVERGPVEQVSVTLSGNPTQISDHMYRGAAFNVTVYSIDWERPSVSRTWVWGNAAGYTATGLATTAGALGFKSHAVTPAGMITAPAAYAGMVGQEIDLGIYNNGSMIDFYGDEPTSPSGASTLPDTVLTSCLFQASVPTVSGETQNASIQMCGGGWDVYHPGPGSVASSSSAYIANNYKLYQGNTNDAYSGQELKRIGYVGGYQAGQLYFEQGRPLFGPASWKPSYVPSDPTATYNSAYSGTMNLFPSALPTGLQYDLRAYTYGYIQDLDSSVFAASGQVADMKINLIIGVNVTLDILFKKEDIITPTNANMSARVRLFDDSGRLVAEWMSSEGTYTTASGFARAADGTNQYPFGNLQPTVIAATDPNTGAALTPLNTYNYLPGGTTLLHLVMAGLPALPASGQEDGVNHFSVQKGTYFGDPVIPTTTGTGSFGLDKMTKPGSPTFAPAFGYFPNYGILGASDYQGGWTAEADFVNLYLNNTSTQELLSGGDQLGSNAGATPGVGPYAQYYPPVTGLLMGESYHIVAGTTATSGISLTEDTAIAGRGHSMAANHLGPYSQRGTWEISGTHNSGEASAIFEVDLNGFVSGNALAFSWVQEFRPLSWGAISVTGAGLPSSGLTFYTFDGLYQAYLPPTVGSGSTAYTFTLNAPGYTPQTWTSAVSSGQSASGQNVYLQQSGIPVPEFSSIAIIAFAALAASLYVLRRRRK
jgi:hypothetical protein